MQPRLVRAVLPVLAVLAAVPAPPLLAQGFASAVAATEREIFVAEPLNPYAKGMVVVYRPAAGGIWQEAARLEAADGTLLDRFGRTLAVEGNRLVVGATSIDSSRGAAYVFERDAAGIWRQVAKLSAAGLRNGEASGRKVALQGERAYVATWGRNEGRGSVTVWRRGADGRWSEEANLMAGDGQRNDFLGYSLAPDGDRILVGAAQRDTASGTAYVFRRDASGQWTEEASFRGSGVARGSGFGQGVALRGEEALVGAPGLRQGAGAVFVFRRNAAGAWEEQAVLTAPEQPFRAQFGGNVALVGEELWVSAAGTDGGRGRIYRLARQGGAWVHVGVFAPEGLDPQDFFGGSFAIAGGVGVVGLTGDDLGMGTAVFATRAPTGGWSTSEKVWVPSKGLDAVVGGKRECGEGRAAIFECRAMDLLAFMPISAIGGGRGVRLNDVWGWTDPQTGREYALVGRMDGTAFVDVSDPVNPVFVGDLPLTAGARPNAWRDIKVYRDHAFIVADGAGQHGMQVFDLSRLRGARGAPVTFTADVTYDRIASAHNIVIDTASGFAFAVGSGGGGETCGGALHMVDIRTPKTPTFAGCFADPATGNARTGYTHDAQCVVYAGPDTAYRGRQICFNSSETALGIADVTDKANPQPISSAAYPNVRYAHQGWLTEDQRFFYMNDEGDEGAGVVPGTRTLIWDVSDLDEPVLAGQYIHDNPSTDHNLYVRGNLMYQSNYESGLRVLDVSNPTAPVLVGFFDTAPTGPDTPNMNGSWSNYPYFQSGTVVVTSIAEGLFILKRSDRALVP